MPAAKSDVEELVTGHLPLVGHLAREASARLPRHLDSDDLVGAGALALVQAANSFDPSLGVPFARFAANRIRGAMIDQMRQRDWATRSIRSRARALAAVSEQLTTALHRTPTDAELAAASGLSQDEVRSVREGTDRAAVLSLNPLTGDDEGIGANLEDSAARPDDALVAAERIGYLRDAIAELPDRARCVVVGYYLDHRPLTDIAEELGVTQSRASQLRAEGIGLLRQALSELLDERPPASEDTGEQPDGVRARRREAYVAAVARRSSVRERADVHAYLAGKALASADNPTTLTTDDAPRTLTTDNPTTLTDDDIPRTLTSDDDPRTLTNPDDDPRTLTNPDNDPRTLTNDDKPRVRHRRVVNAYGS